MIRMDCRVADFGVAETVAMNTGRIVFGELVLPTFNYNILLDNRCN